MRAAVNRLLWLRPEARQPSHRRGAVDSRGAALRDRLCMTPRDEMGWERSTGGDVVGVGVLLALLAPYACRTVEAAAAGGHGIALGVALVLGVLAADFITGCLHWFADTFFAEDTPLIGQAVIESFREHHRDPLAMTRRSFLRLSHANVIATSLMLVAVWCWRGVVAPSPAPSVFTDAFIIEPLLRPLVDEPVSQVGARGARAARGRMAPGQRAHPEPRAPCPPPCGEPPPRVLRHHWLAQSAARSSPGVHRGRTRDPSAAAKGHARLEQMKEAVP